MSDGLPAWAAVRARVRALPRTPRAAFALAVTEHLVARTRPEHDPLWAALQIGWHGALDRDDTWEPVREELARRPDVDDDDVAAVYYALGAAAGSAADAEWAAQRCLDAAFDRVAYPASAGTFRPVEVDAAEPVVREELSWQETVLDLLEKSGATAEIISRLRA